MSNDPIQPERRPFPYTGEPQHYPPGGDPYDAAFGGDREAARRRVKLPAIFLIIVGVLNLLPNFCGGSWLYQGIAGSEETFDKQLEFQPPQNRELLRANGIDGKKIKEYSFWLGVVTLAISLLTGTLAILGGVRMMQLKSYGISVLGALVAIFSPSTLCLIGLIVGIWAVAVLLSANVRAAFRQP